MSDHEEQEEIVIDEEETSQEALPLPPPAPALDQVADLFEAILNRLPTAPQTTQGKLKFADFDPATANAKSWIRTANLIMTGRQNISISDLAMALTNSMKGTASEWFAEIVDDTLTWAIFTEMFTAKYCLVDTPAATIYQAITAQTKDGDSIKLISEHLVKIRGAFRGKTSDECGLILAAAIAARVEPEIKKWAYTQDALDEVQLMKQLKAVKATKPRSTDSFQSRGSFRGQRPTFTGQKRPFTGPQAPQFSKRPRPHTPNTSEPRQPNPGQNQPSTSNQQQQKKWCPKCKKDNHTWARCRANPRRMEAATGTTAPRQSQSGTSQQSGGQQPYQERRVQSCAVNPQGELQHQGVCDMVLSFTLTHTFKYPVDLVTKAYARLHEQQNNVSVVEEKPTQEGPSMLCTKRTVSMLNPFPTFFQRISKVKLLKEETVAFFEDIWTQESERRVWIRSRNLTWEDEISIGSVVYVSPSENNQNWSTWEDITALDFEHCGKYGLLLELFLKRKMETTKVNNIKMMETILEKMVDGELKI